MRTFLAHSTDKEWGRKFAIAIWSTYSYCFHTQDAIIAYIHEKGLGTVTKSEEVENPNSGNSIIMYTWVLNWPALLDWEKADTEKVPKPKLEWKKAKVADNLPQANYTGLAHYIVEVT